MERESFEIEDTQTLLESFALRRSFPLHKSPEWFSGRYWANCWHTGAFKIQMQYEVNPRSSSVLSEGSPESHIAKPFR